VFSTDRARRRDFKVPRCLRRMGRSSNTDWVLKRARAQTGAAAISVLGPLGILTSRRKSARDLYKLQTSPSLLSFIHHILFEQVDLYDPSHLFCHIPESCSCKVAGCQKSHHDVLDHSTITSVQSASLHEKREFYKQQYAPAIT
jgi:hypothetical protein